MIAKIGENITFPLSELSFHSPNVSDSNLQNYDRETSLRNCVPDEFQKCVT